MPLILPGNVGSATAATTFEVANSCRFNYGDSAYMTKTIGTPSSTTAWTLSMWFKLGSPVRSAAAEGLFTSFTDTNNRLQIVIEGSELEIFGKTGGSTSIYYLTEMKFRDHSAWYHLCIAADTSDGTAADRVKVYLNGVRIEAGSLGSFSTYTQAASNRVFECAVDGAPHLIAAKNTGSIGSYYDGYLAEVVFIDGSQLAPTSFGEFDEDSPTIWKPIDVSGLTFGNNGYYLDFEASGNLGNDANGGTDLTETNVAAVDQCTDSPTNNFCTLNPIDSFYRATWGGYTEGNTVATTSSTGGDYAYATTTIGLTAGKWYWEQKIITESGSAPNYDWVGVTGRVPINDTDYVGKHATGYGYLSDDNIYNNNSATDNWGDTFGANDIMSVALDLDNLKLYFAKNGTWQNSGDPTSGATGTGAAYTVTAVASTPAGAYFPTCGDYAGGAGVYAMNFGNPSYANSSDAADANGYGKFEYAPPSGYLAICTKNLGSDGG